MRKIQFNDLQTKNIINRYNSGESFKDIAKEYECNWQTIKRLLEKNDIKSRANRKHFYNEDIFNVIDTAEKAYWIGFITADGYINEDKNFLRIKLQECDKKHLESFISFIGGDQKMIKTEIHNITNNIQYYAEVNGKPFIKSLVDLGLRQGKSTNEKWCNKIPNEYIKDYVRGIIDGDGHINIGVNFDICNSYEVLEHIQDWAIKNYNTTKTKIYNHCGTYRLHITVNHVKILQDIYYPRCVALDRKKYAVILSLEIAMLKSGKIGSDSLDKRLDDLSIVV